jgi:hypothetical protein
MMTDINDIDARLKRVEATLAALLAPKRSKRKGRHIDPKFRNILRRSMDEKELSASDLAGKIWGRHISSEGKDVAKGRDRISVWLAGKEYPSPKNMALLAQFVDVV